MHTYIRTPLALLALGTLALTACEDDLDPREEANNRLQGDWDVTSFTRDGVEFIGAGISVYEIEFEKSDAFEGEAEENIIYSSGESERFDLDYEIEDDGNAIEYGDNDLDLEVDGDDLTMSGNVDGFRFEIEAERD